MKLKILPQKNIRGYIVSYRARVEFDGEVAFDVAIGSSKEEAIRRGEACLRAFLAEESNRRYWHTRSGETLCLYRGLGGWCYDITRPGQAFPSSCQMGNIPEKEAIACVERHVAQYNESHEASLQTELAKI